MEKRNEKMMHVKLPISDDKGSEFLEWKENIWGCLPLSMFDPVLQNRTSISNSESRTDKYMTYYYNIKIKICLSSVACYLKTLTLK